MSFYFHGIGTALPPRSLTQSSSARLAQSFRHAGSPENPLAARMFERCGVENRHMVVLPENAGPEDEGQTFYRPAEAHDDFGPTTGERMQFYESAAAGLALPAAQRAMHGAQISPGEVTHLITISCTGFQAPGIDVSLMRNLGLPAGIARTHIGFMGCHAALNGWRVAKAFTDGNPESCVLMCAVELSSLHYQYRWSSDAVVANALFADGAAAVVGKSGPSSEPCWQLRASASTVVPETEEMMRWRVGDHGFEMTLSPRVPELIDRHLGDWLARWLATEGFNLRDIAAWAVHPGGPRILAACQTACGLDAEALRPSTEVLAELGNMSSPTVLFILERLKRRFAGEPCVVLAFGPGLTIEAALLT
jgi:predicted naringenin-chalcone synthase